MQILDVPGHEANFEYVVVVGREGEFPFIGVFSINEVLSLGVDDHEIDALFWLSGNVVFAGDQNAFVDLLLEAFAAVRLQVEHQSMAQAQNAAQIQQTHAGLHPDSRGVNVLDDDNDECYNQQQQQQRLLG